jgi:hypothetical protein
MYGGKQMKQEFSKLPTEQKVLALQIFNELLQNEQQKALQAVHAHNAGYRFWRHFHKFNN